MRRLVALLALVAAASPAGAAPARKAGVDEFLHALQNPQNLGHPQLRRGRIETIDNGPFGAEPWLKSGGNAWVFKGYTPDGAAKAIRTYKAHDAARETRYGLIQQYLARKKSIPLVRFEYLKRGVQVSHVDGKAWEPAMFLDWVQGNRLDHHLEQLVDAHDTKTIGALARSWRTLMTKLRSAKVAHGDLQHGNIYVRGKGFELLDPDAMYVPGMENHWSGELGHRNFQHPEVIRGQKRVYGPQMDHFASLVVYLSLRALEADPSLWQERKTGEGLLLSDQDFHDPKGSTMIAALSRSPSAEVRTLTAELVSTLARSDVDARHLDDLLPAPVKKPRAPRRPPPATTAATQPAAPADPGAELLQAIAAEPPLRKARAKKTSARPVVVQGASSVALDDLLQPGKPASGSGNVFSDFAGK